MSSKRSPEGTAMQVLIEAARLLGATQAKKGIGYYTREDARFERAMHESISDKAKRLTAERDEARAERDALRLAIDRHRRNVCGDLSVRYSDAVRHPEDSSLYAALAQIEKEKANGSR